MAARGTGASSSARSVSPYRSRSKVRPSASVPANSIAIHRIPAAASSSGSPSLTNAIENVRRDDDDRAARGEATQSIDDSRHGAIVEAGERLVEQNQPRDV